MNQLFKNPFERKQKGALLAMCVAGFLLFMAAGCGSQEFIENEGDNLHLKDTKWTVVGIWYEESGVFMEPKIECEECYSITFDTDTTAYGIIFKNTFGLVFTGKKVKSDVKDSTHEKEGVGACYWEAGIVDKEGYLADMFPTYYQDALFAVCTTYSVNDTEIQLFFSEPVGIADWDILGIERPKQSFNSYLLFKKVK